MKNILFLLALLSFFLKSCSNEDIESLETEVKAVDLGLPSGTLWANMNVGASSECDCGSFYAWAETFPKEQYDWTTYKYINSEDRGTKMSKYCFSSLGAIIDYKETLDLEDDAARQNWGQNWRIPTLYEMNELLVYCTWVWTSSYKNSGIAGYIVKSKIDGYRDKFVFFPAAGHMGGLNQYDTNKMGMYWTSSLDYESFASLRAAQLYFNDGSEANDYGTPPCSTMSYDRQIGMSIRPVINDNPLNRPKEWDVDGIEQDYEYVDLGLSVKWATCNIGADNPKQGGYLYSWGEIASKFEYSIKTYKYSSNGSKKMLKYNKEDGLTTLEPEDDAAYMNWGNKWRVPTNAEFEELIENCDWTQNALGGVCGTSKINGKKIIMSNMTGYRADGGYSSTTEGGHYWSSNNNTLDFYRAWSTIISYRGSYMYRTSNINRYDGLAIRPVLKE